MHSFFKEKLTENALEKFDFQQVERLFIENRLYAWIGQKQFNGKTINTIHDILQPNYFPTQIKAFLWGLDTMPDKLNFAWINHLHELAITNLFHEELLEETDERSPIERQIRNHSTYLLFPNPFETLFAGTVLKASLPGLNMLGEYNESIEETNVKANIHYILDIDSTNMFNIDKKTAVDIYQNQLELFETNQTLLQDIVKRAGVDPISVFTRGKFDKEDLQPLTSICQEISTIPELHDVFFHKVGYVLLDINPFQIRSKAEQMIDKYNAASMNTDNEKIDAIIMLVKGLLNLHVWADGNGRLCAHHLLNLLLVKNGLRPALLENNCLDSFTPLELRQRIQHGMQKFLTYCNMNGQTNLLEKYREENNLSPTRNGSIIESIINNNITNAKQSCIESGDYFTSEELHFLASCGATRVDWFNLPVDEVQIDQDIISREDFYNLLLELSLQYGNHDFLTSLLEYVFDHGQAISFDNIENIITMGTLEMFQHIINRSSADDLYELIQHELVEDFIPFCQDSTIAIELIKMACQNNQQIDLVQESFISDFFNNQNMTVISYYLNLPHVTSYFLRSDNETDLQAVTLLINNRYDLTINEKRQLLALVHPDLENSVHDPFHHKQSPNLRK